MVDVYFLERTGLRAQTYLEAALAKDAGATPATLAWLLSEIVTPDDAKLPAGVSAAELRTFILSLVHRCAARASLACQRFGQRLGVCVERGL